MSNTPEPETYTLPAAAPPNNEGSTPAAWMMFWGVCVGLLIGVVGFSIQNLVLLVAGAVIIVVGLLASFGMRKAGMGQPLEPKRERDWYDDRARAGA